MTVTEFAIPKSWDSDRRGPARWIASHAARHKIFIAGVFFGAFSSAALAVAVPLLIGRAFDAVAATPPGLRGLGKVAGRAELYNTYFRHQSPDYKPAPLPERGG